MVVFSTLCVLLQVIEFEWMALSTTQWCPLSTHNLLLFAWCSRSVRWQLILSIKGGVDKLAIPFNLLHPLLSGLQKSVIVKGAYKIGGCVCVYLYKLKYVCFEKLWFYGMDKRGGGNIVHLVYYSINWNNTLHDFQVVFVCLYLLSNLLW